MRRRGVGPSGRGCGRGGRHIRRAPPGHGRGARAPPAGHSRSPRPHPDPGSRGERRARDHHHDPAPARAPCRPFVSLHPQRAHGRIVPEDRHAPPPNRLANPREPMVTSTSHRSTSRRSAEDHECSSTSSSPSARPKSRASCPANPRCSPTSSSKSRRRTASGFGTAWVAESHLSCEVQKRNPGAVIPHFKGEIGLNVDLLQMAHVVFGRTERIQVGSAVMNILCNGGPVAQAERLRFFLAMHGYDPEGTAQARDRIRRRPVPVHQRAVRRGAAEPGREGGMERRPRKDLPPGNRGLPAAPPRRHPHLR